MAQDKILPDTKKFLVGLILGVIIGCVLGQCSRPFSRNAPIVAATDSPNTIAASTLNITSTLTQTIIYTPTITKAFTLTPSPTLIESSTLTLVPNSTSTLLPPLLNIPYTACGDHIAYTANTQVYPVPIIENDVIIAQASWALITYRIRNTYDNTPIYGFKLRLSPGYDNPRLYPDTLFNSNAPFQPNEEVSFKSTHLFYPDGWVPEKHPTAFSQLPEIPVPEPHGFAAGGYTVEFQIVEVHGAIDNYKEEIQCHGAIRIQ